MKNLFNYATKELSQDAFLRWLFENYNCENEKISKMSLKLLNEFLHEKVTAGNISALETKSQWNKTDVTVWITLDNGKKHLIVIEDKAKSEEHNQLETYNSIIKNEKEYYPHYIFYKPYYVTGDEESRVKGAGWELYGINKIVELFGGFKDTGSEILDDYIEYINEISGLMNNHEMPETDNDNSDSARWIGFFDSIIKNKPNFEYHISKTQYGYVYLGVWIKGNRWTCPYLEVRSRDLTKEKKDYKAYILAYGDIKNKKEKVESVCTVIDAQSKIFSRRMRRGGVMSTLATYAANKNEYAAFTQFFDECLKEYKTIIDNSHIL